MFRLNLSRPFARQHKGQALVEFSLTILVFLLLLFLIIEVARILQAYITVQHAARMAARYATTGQWEEEYVLDPLVGWDWGEIAAGNPEKAIRPCWPLFYDDPVVGSWEDDHRFGIPTGSPTFYQPLRNARTCSVEMTATKALTGLALDPSVQPNQPHYYQIGVWGAGDGVDVTDTFDRDAQTNVPYSNYYSAPEPQLTAYRGFAGDPQQKVWVKIEYWVPINTPILRDIAPAVRVEGTAVMTNEAFGSTGLQREAIQAPDLPPIDITLSQPTPPDMIVSSITYEGGTTLQAGDPMPFEFVIKNEGTTGVPDDVTDYLFSVYAYPAPGPSLETPLTPSGRISLGQITLSASEYMLGAGQSSPAFQVPSMTFPTGLAPGDYVIVAWVDADETGDGTGSIAENDPDLDILDQENNNASKWTGGTIDLLYSSPLELTVSFWNDTRTEQIDEANAGQPVVYRVVVHNTSGDITVSNASVVLADATPSGGLINETLLDGSGYSGGTWTIGDVAPGATETLDLGYNVGAVSSGTEVAKSATLYEGADEVGSDQDSLLIGVVDLSVTKFVSDETPQVGDIITYTITVDNLRSNEAENVRLVDVAPADALSFVSVDFPSGVVDCSETSDTENSTLTCDWLGNMAGADPPVQIIAEYEITSNFDSASIVNKATVSSDSVEVETSNNTATASLDVQTADVEITVEAQDAESVDPGQEVEFLVTVENVGDITANDVYVTLEPDGGLVEGSTAPDFSAGTSYTVGSLEWDIGTLLPNDPKTLSIWFYADPATVVDGELLELIATVYTSSYETEVDQENNEDADYLVVESEADLVVKQEIDGVLNESITLVDLGQVFDYALIISNDGPDDTVDVLVEGLDAVLNFSVLTIGSPTVTVTGGSSTPDVTIVGGNVEIDFLESGQEVRLFYNDVQVSTSPGAAGERIDYDLEVSTTASVDPDTTNNVEAHIMMVTPNPFFVNAGDQNNWTCNSIHYWGADDPVLGQNVEWVVNQPYTYGNSWGYWGNPRLRSDDQPSIYQYPPPYPPTPTLTGSGNRLFGCRAETRFYDNEFGYTFDNLAVGLYEVISIYQDDNSSRRFTVEASGNGGIAWDYILGSSTEGFSIIESLMTKWGVTNPNDARYVYDLERSVVPVIDSGPVDNLGELQVRFTSVNYVARLMGLGYRFFEPLRIDPLPVGFHEDHHPLITYIGDWEFLESASATAGHFHWSDDSNAQIYFRIDGDGLILYRTLRPSNPGIMEVCIDGETPPCAIQIDNSGTTRKFAAPYFITGLGAGVHLIEINNISPVGGQFELDAVQVLPDLVPLEPGLHEENDPNVVYVGDWRNRFHDSATDGHWRYSSDLDASAIFQINGDGLTIIRRTHRSYGSVEVCIDGEASPCSITVSMNARPRVWQSPFTITGLGPGVHTIVINNSSPETLPRINIDAIEVLDDVPALTPGHYEEDHAGIFFPGDWQTLPSASASGGEYMRTEDHGASMTFEFDGTGFSIFRTIRTDISGAIEVCVDGAGSCVQIDDGGATSGQWQAQYYWTGLTSGTHVVEVTALLDAGERVELDAVSVFGAASPLPVGTTDDTNDTDLLYSGTWRETSGTHLTDDTGATVEFQVTGTAGGQLIISRWVGPDYGQMEVCVDTDCEHDVSNYAGAPALVDYVFPIALTGATQDVIIRNESGAGGDRMRLNAIIVN